MKDKPVILKEVYEHLTSSGEPFYGLNRTHAFMEAYSCDLNPDYQRGHVWTMEQRENFIGHMCEGGWVSPCIINTGTRGDMLYGKMNEVGSSQVLDGKQRITTCLMFENGEVAGRLSDGRTFKVTDLDKRSLSMLSMEIGMRYKIVELSRRECLYWYCKLNRGGTVHSAEEIARVQSLIQQEDTKS